MIFLASQANFLKCSYQIHVRRKVIFDVLMHKSLTFLRDKYLYSAKFLKTHKILIFLKFWLMYVNSQKTPHPPGGGVCRD